MTLVAVRDNPDMSKKPKPEPVVPPETPAQREDPDFVTAVARGFAILRCFKRGERALGNKDMATRTGLPRSTIARLTHTLTELGYLEYLPSQEKYALGIPVLSFGQAYLTGLDLRDVARPQMQDLANEVKGTVSLAGRSGDDMMFLELAHGNPTFALRVSVGERVPRGTSALGRAYSGALPPEERERNLQMFKRTVPKGAWAAAEASVREGYAEYEQYGVCLSLGDWNPDVHAVSTPMVSADGHKIVAFSASFPAHMADRRLLLEEIAPKLKAMRDRISHQLGGVF
ncbi:MAG TPA: IclR family transcriptional regulator [Ramlibacter sp.]|nr:IclR family transcriptional regulator [Ramlibacter sp.]